MKRRFTAPLFGAAIALLSLAATTPNCHCRDSYQNYFSKG